MENQKKYLKGQVIIIHTSKLNNMLRVTTGTAKEKLKQ